MFQRDGGDGYAGYLASGDNPGLEFLGVAPTTSTRRRRFSFDSVHVSAYSLSGHDTPKPFNDNQGELPSRLRGTGKEMDD
jgi:hypothetical protein